MKQIWILFLSVWNWLASNIWHLFKKDFSPKIYDDDTGRRIIKDGEPIEYRGLILYLKELTESLLAYFLIILFIIACYEFMPTFFSTNPCSYLEQHADKIKCLLTIIGTTLIFDSILHVAALVNSPGINEIVDSISIALTGLLLDFLGKLELAKLYSNPQPFYTIVIPTVLLLVVLLIAKHLLKNMTKECGKGDEK